MKPDNDTDVGGAGAAFLTTHWSIIRTIGSGDTERDRSLIGLLMNQYWKPIYYYLRRKGHDNEQAKDLTQGFFHEIVLGRHLIEKADPAKGRFRSLLLVALDRYVANVATRQASRRHIPADKLVPLDVCKPPELPDSVTGSTPTETFHYAWISDLLERALDQARDNCNRDGLIIHWYVFQDRVLDPIVNRSKTPPLREVCRRYGIQDEAKASNMIMTVKRRLRKAIVQQVRNSVVSDEDVEGEMDEIRRYFSEVAQEVM